MDRGTIFTKTAKGLLEATGKSSALSRDLRAVLKEVDGKADLGQLLEKFARTPEAKLRAALENMKRDGYVRELLASQSAPAHGTQPTRSAAGTDGGDDLDLDFTSMVSAGRSDSSAAHSDSDEVARKAGVDRARRVAQEKAEREKAQRLRAEAVVKARIEAEAQAEAKAQAAALAKLEAEAKAKADAEARARRDAEEKARREADALKEQLDAERKAREDAERRAQAEAQRWAREEAERKAREVAERKAQEDAERKAREEAEQRAREDAERREREEAELRAQLEAERKAREDAERRAQEEAERWKREEAERREREEAERQTREQAELRAREEAERREREEAERRAQEEAERKAREEAEQQAREEAERRERDELERRAREEAERRAIEEAELRAQLEAERKAREEAERRAQEEAERWKREEAERQAREQAELRAREEAERKARDEAEQRAREEAESREREEAERREREEAELRAREEAERRKREEAELRAQEEAERRAREEAERQAREEAERRAREEAERREREEAERKARDEQERVSNEEVERGAREQSGYEEGGAVSDSKTPEQEDSAAETHAVTDSGEPPSNTATKTAAQARREARARERAMARQRREAEPEEVASSAEADFDAEEDRGDTGSRRNWARLIAAGFFVVLIAAIAVIHVMPLDVAPYEQAAQKSFGEQVRIGSIHIRLLPRPHLVIEQVAIGATDSAGRLRIRSLTAVPDLGSMFTPHKVFKSIEVDRLALPPSMIQAALWGRSEDDSLSVGQLVVKNLKLGLKGMDLPSFDVQASFGAGGLDKVKLFNSEKNLTVSLQRKGAQVGIAIETTRLDLPFGRSVSLDEFSAKGVVDKDALTLKQFDARAFGGYLSGTARLAWGGAWSLTGAISARGMDATKLAAPILSSGVLEGKGTYRMKSDAPQKLMAGARIEGSFSVRQGTVDGVDLKRALQQAPATGGSTRFVEMTGSFDADSQRIVLGRFKLSSGFLVATGAARLDAWKKLSGHMRVELRARSVQARAALTISGTLDEPQFRPAN